jgi:hypothetical protein
MDHNVHRNLYILASEDAIVGKIADLKTSHGDGTSIKMYCMTDEMHAEN